jgi:hypothetical protein
MEIPNVAIAERIKSLIITIDENRDQEVLDQLQKFAEKHSLEFILSLSSGKAPYDFDPVVYGDGFHIIGGRRAQGVYIIFYTDINNKTPNPAPIPQETLDELFNDLQSFLGEIPNATVADQYGARWSENSFGGVMPTDRAPRPQIMPPNGTSREFTLSWRLSRVETLSKGWRW